MATRKHGRILVVGAGPVGLVTALGLAHEGVDVTVIEAEPALTHDLRAGSFHPPTLQALEPLGITPRMLAAGIKVPQWQIRDRKEGVIVQWDLGLLKDETPYCFRLHLEQHKLTPMLFDRLRDFPNAQVRFSTRFVKASQDGDGVIATVEGPDGPETIACDYLVGCDGGRSAVRKDLGVEFEGYTWPERFLVISSKFDLGPHGYTENAYIADPTEWAAIFKMPHDGPPGLWRVLFPTDASVPEEAVLDLGFCRRLLDGLQPGAGQADIPYRSTYRVHQRVCKDFRFGRVILAGDAAHLNNPLGAFGLNSGIHDAANLYPKLAKVWKGEADESLLDLYVRQRRTVTIEFIQALSIRNKRMLEERDPAVRKQRLDELRRTAADPVQAKAFLMNSSMIASVRRAAEIE
ncbi:MAG TPA: FAD-dependent oxidoreductase [Alphaproteobacteria bacterium]